MRSSSERLARRRLDGGAVAELVFAFAFGSREVPEGRACGLGGSGAGEAEEAAGLKRRK